jgi:hypothetical protein
MNGQVIDSETGAPIAGALVIAEWTGDIGGPVQSSRVCFHMEVAKTDAEGRYHIPGWSRRPVTDTEGGFFGIRNVEVSRRTYKAGYEQLGYDPNDASTIVMRAFKGSDQERIEYLSHQGTAGCGRHDGSRAHEIVLWQTICEEARTLPSAAKPSSAKGTSFLQEIDVHLAYLADDPRQERAGRALDPPRVCG